MAEIKEYLDKAGLQKLWIRICNQDKDLLNKITENSNAINMLGAQVEYDTAESWNKQSNLVSKKGVIYVYSNAKNYDGQQLPRIKIGNGVNLLKDLYFMDQDIIHAFNNIITVTEEEKAKWNEKVSCKVNEEKLIFSTE